MCDVIHDIKIRAFSNLLHFQFYAIIETYFLINDISEFLTLLLSKVFLFNFIKSNWSICSILIAFIDQNHKGKKLELPPVLY